MINKTFIDADDVETQVFDWGRLSWLSEPRTTGTDRFSAGIVQLAPGKGHARHNHPGVEEILFVISGKGLQMVEVNGVPVEREITENVMVHVPPDVFHSTVNTGKGPMILLAIYSPPGPEAILRQMVGVTIEPPVRT